MNLQIVKVTPCYNCYDFTLPIKLLLITLVIDTRQFAIISLITSKKPSVIYCPSQRFSFLSLWITRLYSLTFIFIGLFRYTKNCQKTLDKDGLEVCVPCDLCFTYLFLLLLLPPQFSRAFNYSKLTCKILVLRGEMSCLWIEDLWLYADRMRQAKPSGNFIKHLKSNRTLCWNAEPTNTITLNYKMKSET